MRVVTGTIKHVVKYDGLRGFYRGLGPTLLGYLPTWAIYFAVYDGIKTSFGEPPLGMSKQQQLKEREEERLYPAAQAKGYQPVVREHPWSLHILSAMTAGATSTICTNPLWVIKTRFMVRYPFCFPFFPILKLMWLWMDRRRIDRSRGINIRWMLRRRFGDRRG